MTPSTTSQQTLSTTPSNNDTNTAESDDQHRRTNRFTRDEVAHLHTLFAAIHHNIAWCDTRDGDDWELSDTFPHFADWSHIDDDGGDYNPQADIQVTPGDHLAGHDETTTAMLNLCEAIADELDIHTTDAQSPTTTATTDETSGNQQTTLTGHAD